MNAQALTTLETARTAQLPLTSVKSYNDAIRAFNRSGLTLDDYLAQIRAAGYKPATINHKLHALKKALRLYAERTGTDSTVVRYQIDDLFRRPENKTTAINPAVTSDDCLTAEELRELKAAAPHRTALLIDALYQTAARVSELINVKLSECEQGKHGVKVQITRGKGNKAREVYLSASLFSAIREEYAGRVYLFETATGGRLDRSNIHKAIQAAGHAIGIKNLHPHTLRHTWATSNLDRLGIYKVSHYLGHSDIATTARFYLHNKPTEAEILNTGEAHE